MNHFFIDYENVHSEELKQINEIKEGDEVVLFHSNSCKNITLEALDAITNSTCQFKCQKVFAGTKSALDFQLVSQLGYAIAKNSASDAYFIISKDKGYDCLASYWKQKNRKVRRIEPGSKEPNKQSSPAAKTTGTNASTLPRSAAKKAKQNNYADKKACNQGANKPTTLKEVQAILNKDECPEEILKIINKYKTKQAIANQISKTLKNTQLTGEIYKKLKPLLKEKGKK